MSWPVEKLTQNLLRMAQEELSPRDLAEARTMLNAAEKYKSGPEGALDCLRRELEHPDQLYSPYKARALAWLRDKIGMPARDIRFTKVPIGRPGLNGEAEVVHEAGEVLYIILRNVNRKYLRVWEKEAREKFSSDHKNDLL